MNVKMRYEINQKVQEVTQKYVPGQAKEECVDYVPHFATYRAEIKSLIGTKSLHQADKANHHQMDLA